MVKTVKSRKALWFTNIVIIGETDNAYKSFMKTLYKTVTRKRGDDRSWVDRHAGMCRLVGSGVCSCLFKDVFL
jgi:hypothetical protein